MTLKDSDKKVRFNFKTSAGGATVNTGGAGPDPALSISTWNYVAVSQRQAKDAASAAQKYN